MSRPICEGCGRPMPLTDDERMDLQRREFKEFEDVLDRTPRRRSKTPTSGSTPPVSHPSDGGGTP